MFLRTLKIATFLTAGFLASAEFAFADSPPPADKGKRRLVPLFQDVIAPVTESVVKVYSKGKYAVLGTIVSEDGFILTKGSEVLGGELKVALSDGKKYDAVSWGYHKASDLALLKIDVKELKPIQFPNDDPAEVGNWVVVPGTVSDPLGVGVVSVKSRLLYGDQSYIENANRGFMGIQMSNLDKDTQGVKIEMVLKDSPAKKEGLKVGDIITKVGGKDITNREAMQAILDSYKVGDIVTIRINRDDKVLDFKIKLGSRADRDGAFEQNLMGGGLSSRRTGFPQVIQHDTVLNPNECGGPLLDIDGRILGLNIARAGRVETWTLPGKTIRPILKELLDGKHQSISK
jgi:serine protease Do